MRTPRALVTFPIVALLLAAGCGESHDADGGGPSDLGGPCATVSCAEGLSCLLDERFPDGYCSVVCDDGTCPDGAACDATSSPPLCLASCVAAADCRDGYQCWRGSCRPECLGDGDCGGDGATCAPDGRCEGPECAGDEDCGAMQRCDGFECVPRTDAGAALGPGDACARDEECTTGLCLDAAHGGFCTLPCARAADCLELSAAETGCSALPHDADGDGSPETVRQACAALPAGAAPMGGACTADDECEARLCQQGQCTEVCGSVDDCLAGQTCRTLERAGVPGATYQGCGYADRAGAVAVETIDLGTRDLRAGFLGDVELATPPDAVSVTLQARRASGDPLELSFVTVADPADTVLFDVGEIVALRDQPIRWLPVDTGESVTMLVPNTTADRVAFLPGRFAWTVSPIPRSMGDSGSARVALSALVKRAAGGTVSAGRVDLNVHFVSGVGPGASGAPTHGKMQSTLGRLETILAREGVSVGTVRYFDVADSSYRIISSTDGADSELASLFRESDGRSGRAVNVFFVRSIEGPSGGFAALGVAGGIPGPVGIHGTQHSGVVAVWDGQSASVLGHVLAHELGHYVGLFHSTERLRPCGPGETPEDGCAPFGAGDQLSDTARGDDGNLMYWSIVGGGSNDELSAGQGFVLRTSAAIGP